MKYLLVIVAIAISTSTFCPTATHAFFGFEDSLSHNPDILVLSTPPVVYVSGDGSGDFNCDGSHDQIEINQALDFVAANAEYSTVYLTGPNTYWIDSSIFISADTILEGDSDTVVKLIDNAGWVQFKPLIGQEGTVFAPDLENPLISTSNITIRGFEIDGNKDNQAGIPDGNSLYTLIQLQNCYNITINDMYLHDNNNDAIRFTHDILGADVNSRFFNLRIHDNGHSGIYILSVNNFQVFDNIITSSRTDAGIRPQYCNHFKIFNNIIGNHPDRPSSGGSPIQIEASSDSPVDDVEIYNNYLYGDHYWHGIWLNHDQGTGNLETHQNVHIHHNVITRYRQAGIGIYGFHNTIIENNIIEGNLDGGVVFYAGDPGDDTLSGFQTIMNNNIIVHNSNFGIDNRQPAIHAFLSDFNCVFGNAAGPYGNSSSATDLHVDPLFVADNTYEILSAGWSDAESSGEWTGDLGAGAAWLAYHLKSGGGHWDGLQWIIDESTSPCIDEGNPTADYSNEPFPNGGRINMGAFGNTPEASKSPMSSSLVENEDPTAGVSFFGAYPNPFNPRTQIIFSVPDIRRVKLAIYDLKGQHLATVADQEFQNGTHRLYWNGRDKDGRELATGTYLLRLAGKGQTESCKLILIR